MSPCEAAIAFATPPREKAQTAKSPSEIYGVILTSYDPTGDSPILVRGKLECPIV